jgi:hypothetical protein
MDTLDEDGQRRIVVDICNLLIDMGWPKTLVLEKYFADRFKLSLRREYREAKKKVNESRSKLRLRPFNDVLNERLYKVFRSDGFNQIKLKLGLDKVN